MLIQCAKAIEDEAERGGIAFLFRLPGLVPYQPASFSWAALQTYVVRTFLDKTAKVSYVLVTYPVTEESNVETCSEKALGGPRRAASRQICGGRIAAHGGDDPRP